MTNIRACKICYSSSSAPFANQKGWRNVIAVAKRGIPVPAFSTALAFFDGYRTEQLPANLLQAQRDYFRRTHLRTY